MRSGLLIHQENAAMPFAAELFFDKKTEQKVIEVWDALRKASIASMMLDLGSRPHVTLAVWSDLDSARLEPEIAAFAARTERLEVMLQDVGSFERDTGTVFLRPELSNELMILHADFYRCLAGLGGMLDEFYLPDCWVPHCTVATDLKLSALPQAIQVCRSISLPICGRVEQIGIVEFRPVRHLFAYGLA